jgi:RloB-like protein
VAPDQIHHRRRAKARAALARHQQQRPQYERALIVCEGLTEAAYLRDLARFLGIGPPYVRIVKSGSDPKTVVETAIDLFQDDPDYDYVFCVFDHDERRSFEEAVKAVIDTTLTRREKRKKLGKAVFEAITSVPCFEYWLYLHFKYTTKPFTRVGSKSACDQLTAELRKKGCLPNYRKGDRGQFSATAAFLPMAIANAKRAEIDASSGGMAHPPTRMHVLVESLRVLRTPRTS